MQGERRSVAKSSPPTAYTLRSVPEFGTYGCATSMPSPASSGSIAASRSGEDSRCTARPELPSAGLTTSGYSDAGISASSSGRAAAYVGGSGSPGRARWRRPAPCPVRPGSRGRR